MRDWPPITEPELLERLALDDEAFLALTESYAGAWGRRELAPETYTWALGYPFERPRAAFVLRSGEVQLLDELEPGERAATVAAFTGRRHPLLSYGGNAAPSWLTAKFAHFPDPDDRTVLVLPGRLHGFDVGPAAALAPAGYMPATVFASPETEVRASVVWATDAQVTQLTWSEVPYRLVRLDDATFRVDDDATGVEIDQVFAYLHRLGSLCLDGAPVAMAAIPAAGRRAAALTQEELLDRAAALVLHAEARAADLVRAVYEDFGAVTARARQTVWPLGARLQARWTPHPGVR